MQIAVQRLDPRAVVGIRTATSLATIGDDIGRLAGELAAIAGDRANGPVLARYHAWEGDAGEMEVLLPVDGEIADARVQASTLPGCEAVVAVHVGPYEDLAGAWAAVTRWIADSGLQPGAAPWEEYTDACGSVPPEQLRTTIFFPLG